MNSDQNIYKCPACGDYLDKTIMHNEYYDVCLHKRVTKHSETWDCRNVSCRAIFFDDNGSPMVIGATCCSSSKGFLQQSYLREESKLVWRCAYLNRENSKHMQKCQEIKPECHKYVFPDNNDKPDLNNLT